MCREANDALGVDTWRPKYKYGATDEFDRPRPQRDWGGETWLWAKAKIDPARPPLSLRVIIRGRGEAEAPLVGERAGGAHLQGKTTTLSKSASVFKEHGKRKSL